MTKKEFLDILSNTIQEELGTEIAYDNVKYYNVDITIDGDTLTSHVVVNADKIDVDEITKIDSANGNYYTDGKMMISNVERAFTSLGATCTTE